MRKTSLAGHVDEAVPSSSLYRMSIAAVANPTTASLALLGRSRLGRLEVLSLLLR